MDRLEKNAGSDNDEGFIKTVFSFDDTQKATILNILQYTLLGVIPILLLLKLIKNYIPDIDDDKGSLVILVEVVGQMFAMFLGLYMINRIIYYIPTYSGVSYGDINLVNMILPTMFIILTMQTKIGDKIQIMGDRLWDLYDGQTSSGKQSAQNQSTSQVRITQPISRQSMPPQSMPPQTISAPTQMQTNNKSQTNEYSIPSDPNFNNMFAGPETSMVGAATPGQDMMQEPMAANDAFGGSFGGTPF